MAEETVSAYTIEDKATIGDHGYILSCYIDPSILRRGADISWVGRFCDSETMFDVTVKITLIF